MAAIVGVTAVALPHAGPSLDFAQGTRVAGHIGDRTLTPLPVIQNAPGAWPLLIGYLAAFGCACAAYAAICRLPDPGARTIWIAFALGAAAMLAVGFYPTSDPYAYALYALEAGPLRLDPYVTQSLAGTSLPWAAQLLAIFPDPDAYVRHCNYGPLAVFAYAALALPLAHAPLVAYLFAERMFGIACVALTGLALARSAAGVEGRKRLATYVLHPLVLTEFVAFSHGDALMLLLLALAFVLWQRDAFAFAAAACVAAGETRSVAALALVALFVALARVRPAAVPRAALGALVAALALGGASLAAYGEISLGGAPAFNHFAAPIAFVATLLGVGSLAAAVVLQGAVGAAAIVVVLRRWWLQRRAALAWLSFGALAGLPAIYPHYLGWVAGVAALRPGPRFAFVARVATIVAPVWYVARMNLVAPPQPSALAYGAALVLTWGSAIAAFTSKRGLEE